MTFIPGAEGMDVFGIFFLTQDAFFGNIIMLRFERLSLIRAVKPIKKYRNRETGW